MLKKAYTFILCKNLIFLQCLNSVIFVKIHYNSEFSIQITSQLYINYFILCLIYVKQEIDLNLIWTFSINILLFQPNFSSNHHKEGLWLMHKNVKTYFINRKSLKKCFKKSKWKLKIKKWLFKKWKIAKP